MLLKTLRCTGRALYKEFGKPMLELYNTGSSLDLEISEDSISWGAPRDSQVTERHSRGSRTQSILTDSKPEAALRVPPSVLSMVSSTSQTCSG